MPRRSDKPLNTLEKGIQILTLLSGSPPLQVAEIAERLGVSPRTAKAHTDILRSKLQVSRRRQIPLAFRDATGENPLEGLEPAAGLRDDSRLSD